MTDTHAPMQCRHDAGYQRLRLCRVRWRCADGKHNGKYGHGARTKEAVQAVRYVNLLSRLARKS